ncbi:MAG: hypothetical protein ACKOCM_07010 [Cyanobacteriota bacterium]
MTRAALRTSQPPTWLGWLGTGLTAMLAVLFLVLVQQLREQNEQIRKLGSRVEALENARALERTSALEEQLHSSVNRLQALESLRGEVQRLIGQQQRLQTAIDQLRRAEPTILPPLPPAVTPVPAPTAPPRPGTPGNG